MPSIRDLRNAKRRQSFTGRQAELKTFRHLLLVDEAEYALLHIYGVGGIGKSSLLGQFRRIAQELGYPAAQVDLQVNFGVIEILRTLRSQFEGRYFSEFDRALGTYNQVEGRLQSTAGALSNGLVSGLREGIPFGLGALAVDSVGEERIKNWLYQHLPQNNADLYLHADRILTAHFVNGINALVEKTGKLVIAFDTYEFCSKSQDAWIREILLDSDLSSDVLIAMAGRDKLGGMWREWNSVLLTLELAPFSDAEAREYLARRGITAPLLVDTLLSITGRFPWSLALFTDTPAVQEMNVEELERTAALHNLSDMLVDRFLSQVYADAEMRELVYLCSIPRNFDFDVIRALWGRPDVVEPLDRLRRFSFVRVRDDGRWSIHGVVRSAINLRLKNQSPQRWEELNRNAVEFYHQRAAEWPLYSDEWRWLTLENLYHQIQVREKDGIQLFARLFEAAKRFCHYDFCSELLGTFDEVQLEQPSSQRWVEFYRAKMDRLVDSSAWHREHEINQMLYAITDLDPRLRAQVSIDLGRYYYHFSCQYVEAVAALEEGLALYELQDGESGEAFVLSHLAPAYAAAGMLDKARQAGRRCVTLSQQLDDVYREGWGHYGLGESESHAGNWKSALTHLESAAELFQALDAEFELGVVLRRAGRAQLHLKRWNQALSNYQANLSVMKRYDKYAWSLRAMVDICELHLLSGRLDELVAEAELVLAMSARQPFLAQEARLHGLLAEAALQQGRLTDAGRSYADALIALVQAPGCVPDDIMAQLTGRLEQLLAAGARDEAQQVADHVQGDIEAVLAGRLVRGGNLIELGVQALGRLRELDLLTGLEALIRGQ